MDGIATERTMTQGGLWGEEFAPSGPRRAPSETREAIAERKRRFVARMADIGPIPPVADPERRAAASASLIAFAETYCMGLLLKRKPSRRMREYAERLEASIRGTGKTHVRFPRGAGKTTWVKAAICWACATGRLHFPVVVCASAKLAASAIGDIWRVFSSPGPFAEDFPEIYYPIAAGGNSAQRWNSQTCEGVQTNIVKQRLELHLPTVAGSPSSGTVIRGEGATGAIRGLVFGSERPDFVLIDDIQTGKTAKSPILTIGLSELIQKDILGLAGQDVAIPAVMTSTPIKPDDLSEQYADSEQHPEWVTVESRLVNSWSAREDLWQEYDALWRRAVFDGDTTNAAATAFYREHREEMDEGADVLDPDAYDARLELSGIQHARNLLLSQGRESFESEYQMRPRTTEEVVRVTPKTVAKRVNGVPRGVVPKGMTHVVGFLDVNVVPGISWSCTAFGAEQRAALVEYGRLSGPDGRLCPKNTNKRDETDALANAICTVLAQLFTQPPVREDDGEPMPLAVVLVDMGYNQDAVVNACNFIRREFGQTVYPCKGSANHEYNPYAKHSVTKALHAGIDERVTEIGHWAMQNSDMWKERVHRALLSLPGLPGSLSLFGTSSSDHRKFADEICAESLADKLKGSRGIVRYDWHRRPGVGEHWLDTTAGCYAGASLLGIIDEAATADAAIRKALAAPVPGRGDGATAAAALAALPRVVSARRRGPRLVRTARGGL